MHSDEVFQRAMGLKRNGLKITQIHSITGVARSTLNDWFAGKVQRPLMNIYEPLEILQQSFDGNDRNLCLNAYSYTLGFYFARGHLYNNKRTFEISFHLNLEKFSKFKEAYEFLFKTQITINKNNKNISIYGKHLKQFYNSEKEIKPWHTKVLDAPSLFKGLVDSFDITDGIYTFKTNNEKIQNMFKGCCIQFGLKYEESDCGKVRIVDHISLRKIRKILLDNWDLPI